MTSKTTHFKAAWWLRNPHLQTLWPTLTRRKSGIRPTRQRLELDDGDFIDLDWVGTGNGPIVLLLHGLEGSVNSSYAQWMLKAIQQQGWRGVIMHFRGCSGEPNRLARSYHSGETHDLALVVNHLRRNNPNSPIMAIGYSLGGNVLLKWLGETASNNPLEAAVAVSVPFELDKAADRMSYGFSKFYQWHLIRNLHKSLERKLRNHAHFTLPASNSIKSFWHFDDKITAPLHGFNNAQDYYQRSSSRQYIKHIQTPTLIIHAKDDPFMTEHVIPQPQELPQQVQLELTEHGGHVGFISGRIPGLAKYWLEQRCLQFLQTQNSC